MPIKLIISCKELGLTCIPVALLIAGGVSVLYRKPNAAVQSIILHFAAGVVFSVVAVELLPDMIKIHKPIAIIAGFIMGIASMLLIKWYTAKLELKEAGNKGDQLLPWGMLTAIGIDILLDGLLLGIGFAAGAKEGMLLALALAMECLSLGLAISSSLLKLQMKGRKILLILMGLSVLFVMGAAIGFFVLHYTGDKVLEVVLSFGSAALLFLVTEELLVEAHEQKDSPFYTAAFFAGFLIFMILGIIV
ncbi:transporter [Pedobacter antarcticus 4BY]|uniref:Transporter n=2 Tax=Pedobacter antarcticus TaxID=34086 RepID=A0A081PFV8_9SPHI|nr:transporter [Pedobacter antarcticus]KEQ29581.1 transporter [Pedobacter antarcticus 4BY]SFF44007.1 zinc transporter, ZIP family [Pedobacter antarcticus]